MPALSPRPGAVAGGPPAGAGCLCQEGFRLLRFLHVPSLENRTGELGIEREPEVGVLPGLF